MKVGTFLVGTAAATSQRIDLDGQLLSDILFNGYSDRAVFPTDFKNALKSVVELPLASVSLRRLGKASVSGAAEGCGLCFAIVGFLLSTGTGAVSSQDVHALIPVVPVHLRELYSEPVELFYRAGMFFGSTFGILASLRLALLNKEHPEAICTEFSAVLGLIAQESASDDVLESLMPPSELDFQKPAPPVDFITMDAINDSSEGLDHLINTVRENAGALSSVFLDPADFVELLGIDDQPSGEEIRQSAEHIAGADDIQLGEELLDTINMARYTVNAMRYNEALSLVDDPRTCREAVLGFRDLVENQGLFAKTLFYSVKQNYFGQKKNVENSVFASLLLSESGILVGHMNALNLIERKSSFAIDLRNPDKFKIMAPSMNASICKEDAASPLGTSGNIPECLDDCASNEACSFAVSGIESAKCATLSACVPTSLVKDDMIIFEKSEFVPKINCWNKNNACLVSLRERAAADHNHTQSMNWLTYFFEAEQEMNSSLNWAAASASLGDPEGVFNLARLSLKEWEGHASDFENSKRLFRILWTAQPLYREKSLSGIDEMEVAAAQDVAAQLGIIDLTLERAAMSTGQPAWTWAQRIASAGGLTTVFLYQSWSRLITGLALIPVIFFLISRRIMRPL